MDRETALKIVDQERTYQDKTYPNVDEKQKFLSHHLVLLMLYNDKAATAWSAQGDVAALKEIAKVAALAVRALERVSGSSNLLTEGLHNKRI